MCDEKERLLSFRPSSLLAAEATALNSKERKFLKMRIVNLLVKLVTNVRWSNKRRKEKKERKKKPKGVVVKTDDERDDASERAAKERERERYRSIRQLQHRLEEEGVHLRRNPKKKRESRSISESETIDVERRKERKHETGRTSPSSLSANAIAPFNENPLM